MRIRNLVSLFLASAVTSWSAQGLYAAQPAELFQQYCIDCHDGPSAEGNVDFAAFLNQQAFDTTLIFENIATGKMPPAEVESPPVDQRLQMLSWLADRQDKTETIPSRRISRYEFVQSINDLLGTELDLAVKIPEDRGTRHFDTDRRIQLSPEMLRHYFAVADEMLEHALPTDGFVSEQTWITNKLKDSHKSYNIYVRDYLEGVLFSWTRANNGNSYSFFYDNFDPPAEGWYDLTFDVAKVGEFAGDVSVQVHSGKYYYADDRPQPQRLLDVISVGSHEIESKTIRVFLKPGENVSVHCYSEHNFRDKNPQQGAYIRQLKIHGPVQDNWPPSRYRMLFGGLPIETTGNPTRKRVTTAHDDIALPSAGVGAYRSNLRKIGGSLAVSSFQPGMEKEKMQDGSNRTFWHTRFQPTLAKPPHFVILENPNRQAIEGLSYSAWSGGNGNGQVEKYEVFQSDDRENWGQSIASGDLETQLAHEQLISFSTATTARFIKFVATQSFSLDGRSLASIGRLDVVVSLPEALHKANLSIASNHAEDMRQIVRRFAERAFAANLSDQELTPYFDVAQRALEREGNFIEAAKIGFKAVICSPRFLMVPGKQASKNYPKALARVLWLSVPDEPFWDENSSLRDLAAQMLADERSDRMIHSLCHQWLNLRSWNNVSPSLKLYPHYDDLLNHYLPLETIAYLRHLIRENRPVRELIDSNYSFLNQRLASHYGLEDIQGQHLRKISFAPNVPRGGLLTMGSVLKVTTDGFATSPILRGAWISKNILGTPVSPPPESVKAIEPEQGEQAASLREQIERHKNSDTCYACHKSIDPYGFALENFDATGQWRTRYRSEIAHQGTFQYRREGYFRLTSDVDAAGEINHQPFDDIHQLKQLLLLEQQKIAYQFSKKFFEYANGHEPNLKQRLRLFKMTDSNDCRMRELVIDVLVDSLTGDSQ